MTLCRPIMQDNLDGTWTVMKEMRVEVPGWSEPIVVPEGFVTDFASTPRFIWWAFPHEGQPYDLAACVHDMIYRHLQSKFTRKQADDILLAIMKLYGTGFLTRWCIWLGVRIGGMSSWTEDRTEFHQ